MEPGLNPPNASNSPPGGYLHQFAPTPPATAAAGSADGPGGGPGGGSQGGPQGGGRVPDPGRRRWAAVAWIATIVLVGVVFLFNQAPEAASSASAGGGPPKVSLPKPGLDPVSLASKFVVKLAAANLLDKESRGMLMSQLDDAARTPTDQFRAAIARAESPASTTTSDSVTDACAKLDEIELALRKVIRDAHSANGPATPTSGSAAPAGAPRNKFEKAVNAASSAGAGTAADDDAAIAGVLLDDLALARRVYAGETLDRSAAEGLADRHGWFGKLLLTHGKPNTDAERAALVGGGMGLVAVLAALAGGGTLVLLGGVASSVAMVVLLARGKLRRRFVPPAPGGSVFLESLPVFVAGFVLLKTGTGPLQRALGVDHMTLALVLQWMLIATIMWPVARGMRWSDFRRSLGWHSGAGVLREIGAGVFAYLSAVPLMIVAVVVTFVAITIRAAITGQQGPPSNPVAEAFGAATGWQLVLLGLLATTWAPIAEEAVFRGAFFRHLRSRAPALVAAAASAFVFGAMHSYDAIMLLPVMTLGFVFALMREWRGSLIPSMTAHCLHNAAITTTLIVLMSVIG